MMNNKWIRRAITIPMMMVAWAALTTLLPVVLVGALIFDFVRWRKFAVIRAVLFFEIYLTGEVFAIFMAGILYLIFGGPFANRKGSAYQKSHVTIQRVWSTGLFASIMRVLGVRVEVTGAEAANLHNGPILILSRHASMADTLIPLVYVGNPHGLSLRYAMKRELLSDPAIDLFGNRLTNYFVRRGAGNADEEAAQIAKLAHDLSVNEGVALFPEGTRYTAKKRERLLAKFDRVGDHEMLARVRALKHTLPPRARGVLALFASAPAADVVIVGHSGLEAIRSFADVVQGRAIGTVVRIDIRRIPRSEVPTQPGAQEAWLAREWQAMDDWVDGVAPKRASLVPDAATVAG